MLAYAAQNRAHLLLLLLLFSVACLEFFHTIHTTKKIEFFSFYWTCFVLPGITDTRFWTEQYRLTAAAWTNLKSSDAYVDCSPRTCAGLAN